jgi:predicted RNA-binding Zn-ribbon protein involved in translation (DUF1610 family)
MEYECLNCGQKFIHTWNESELPPICTSCGSEDVTPVEAKDRDCPKKP